MSFWNWKARVPVAVATVASFPKAAASILRTIYTIILAICAPKIWGEKVKGAYLMRNLSQCNAFQCNKMCMIMLRLHSPTVRAGPIPYTGGHVVRWAEVCFPRLSNLHLCISIWYSSTHESWRPIQSKTIPIIFLKPFFWKLQDDSKNISFKIGSKVSQK